MLRSFPSARRRSFRLQILHRPARPLGQQASRGGNQHDYADCRGGGVEPAWFRTELRYGSRSAQQCQDSGTGDAVPLRLDRKEAADDEAAAEREAALKQGRVFRLLEDHEAEGRNQDTADEDQNAHGQKLGGGAAAVDDDLCFRPKSTDPSL